MSDPLTQLRAACALVAERAERVRLIPEVIPGYAAALPAASPSAGGDEGAASAGPDAMPPSRPAPECAYWITLDAINFGSGWFPTLRKAAGRSGYFTIAQGLRERFTRHGPWTAEQLAEISPREVAQTLGQDPRHELMQLFARSLRDLGTRLGCEHGGSFSALIDGAGGSAVALVEQLSGWPCFADRSTYRGIRVPFLKRAQIAAADVHRTGLVAFSDLRRLTMFADNLVPHVLRLDGLLEFDPVLVQRIEREQLIEHDSPEEIEIRAC
ncbi:MAG TPA: queuosine salvage family protein, partial [Solirubrobacteraceae bacterium]|nr:queuosine salvage family protein [Solirubrobacteraceae bacterium]